MAFTLAEVLITLGIIGVVAALTMPSLIAKHQEKQTVVKLKKAYSLLTQAYTQIKEEEGGGPLSYHTFNDSGAEMMKRFGKFIKLAKECPTYSAGCFDYDKPYKTIKGEYYAKFDGTEDTHIRSSAILADGTTMMFSIRSHIDSAYGQIYVDTNGSKAPNQLGVDFFYFFLYPERIVAGGNPCDSNGCNYDGFINNCLNGSGTACGAWVIHNDNMDYLHCDDLSWQGKHKCK